MYGAMRRIPVLSIVNGYGPRMTESLDLVGAQEIAVLLGVSRQRVHALVTSQTGFPEPVAQLASGRVWRRHDIFTWAAATGRELTTKTVTRP